MRLIGLVKKNDTENKADGKDTKATKPTSDGSEKKKDGGK